MSEINQVSGNKNPDIPDETGEANVSKYLKMQKKRFGLDQKLITNLEYSNGRYISNFQSGAQKILAVEAVSNVVSQNKLGGIRTVFLGKSQNPIRTVTPTTHLPMSLGEITTSNGMVVSVSPTKREITFTQTNQNDWALLKSSNLTNWRLKFLGKQKSNSSRLPTDNVLMNMDSLVASHFSIPSFKKLLFRL